MLEQEPVRLGGSTATQSTPLPTREAREKPIYNREVSFWAARVQRAIGWFFLLPFSGFLLLVIKYYGRYRIENIREIRKLYREVTRDKSPLLICANHLTFIDSALMVWAMGSLPWYFFHYRCFSWNLPAGDFFKKKFVFRVIAYLSKCIFIHRDGSRAHRSSVLDLCRELLARGEVVTIFPEGRRSRSGRFDREKLTFGTGKIISEIGQCRVLCVYLRGEHQENYTNYPRRGSRFHIEAKLIVPKSHLKGRAAYHEIVHQIGAEIGEMENRYFAEIGKGLPC